METKLIAVTKPISFQPAGELSPVSLTPEQFIVYIARVSNPANQMNTETASKLLKYLVRNKHWSPFEMVHVCMKIETTRDIGRQILRHRSFSFQEFSQRYAEVTEFEDVELRLQGDSKQGSGEVFNSIDIKHKLSAHIYKSKHLYKKLIAEGVSRETARMYLPLCTQTKLYMNGTVRSWIHYLETRLKDDTQKEHRLIAEEVKQIFKFE
jgi:thymidylate synthase (FAD)